MKGRKPLRHKWKQLDGFRVDECVNCGATRKWDDGFGRIIYYDGNQNGPFFFAPTCKSTYTSDVGVKY